MSSYTENEFDNESEDNLAGLRTKLDIAFRLHAHKIVRYFAYRGITNQSDAEEMAQSTFEVAWRFISKMPEEPDTLIWLYRISWRQLHNYYRGTRRFHRLIQRIADETDIAFKLNQSSDPDEKTERIAALALRSLRPREAEAFRLVQWDDLTHAEAAAVMGCSVNAFNLLIFRARHRLDEEIERLRENEHE